MQHEPRHQFLIYYYFFNILEITINILQKPGSKAIMENYNNNNNLRNALFRPSVRKSLNNHYCKMKPCELGLIFIRKLNALPS